MRALSLWQPWASLWIAGPKVHETRAWSTDYRGALVVHAAKHKITPRCLDPDLVEICTSKFGSQWTKTLPIGALLGTVQLEACTPCDDQLRESLLELDEVDFDCGDFRNGRFAWRRGPQTEAFRRPIPYVGRQRFFDVPVDLVLGAVA